MSMLKRLYRLKKYIYIVYIVILLYVFINVFSYYNKSSANVAKLLITSNIVVKTTRKDDDTTITTTTTLNDFNKVNADLSKCLTFYNATEPESLDKYGEPANASLHNLRICKGVMVYFPATQANHFEQEFKWLYRSWLEMLKYEPSKWRSDLIIFVNKAKLKETFFDDMNCKLSNLRKNKTQAPMCTLIQYTPINERSFNKSKMVFKTTDDLYEFILKKVDVFNDEREEDYLPFYEKAQDLKTYSYVDSILIGFEGYKYLNASYDFLIRSDMDTFLTPLFAQWLPKRCNDFYVGRGAYSTDFNTKRLKRISNHLKLENANARNLGSTWYSTPRQFRLTAYLTISLMSYVYNEEFSQPEREGKVGTVLWPEWHFGVLLLYGQHLALNHLIGTKQMNVIALHDLIDYPSGNDNSIFKYLHIHVFHGDNIFSKFVFRAGKYDNMTVAVEDRGKVKFYCLYIALESKNMTSNQFVQLLNQRAIEKT